MRTDEDHILIVVISAYVSAAGLAFLDECIEMLDANTESVVGFVITGEHTDSHTSIQASSRSTPEIVARARAAIDPHYGRVHIGFVRQSTGMMHSKTWAIGIVPNGAKSIADMNSVAVVTGSANLTHGGLWGNEEEMTRPHEEELPRLISNIRKLVGESYPAAEMVTRLIDARSSTGPMSRPVPDGTHSSTQISPATVHHRSQSVTRDLGCLPILLLVVGVIFIVIILITIGSAI